MIRMRAGLTCALALLLLAPTGTGAAGEDLSQACAEVDTSAAVPVCLELHENGLRLPEGSAGRPLGAIGRSRPALLTVDGRALPLSRAVRAKLSVDRDYAGLVYEAATAGGKVRALTPRLRVTDGAVLEHLFGGRLLIGRISGRSRGSFKSTPRLPIVIELAKRSAGGRLTGVIRNATRPVRAAGICHPALSRADDDPLGGGFRRRIAIERIPSMHMPFSDQMILAWTRNSSGMGSEFYASVATLFGRDRMGRTWRVVQHGNPSSGPALALKAAEGALNDC